MMWKVYLFLGVITLVVSIIWAALITKNGGEINRDSEQDD